MIISKENVILEGYRWKIKKMGWERITICFLRKLSCRKQNHVIWDFKKLIIKIVNFRMQFLKKKQQQNLVYCVKTTLLA